MKEEMREAFEAEIMRNPRRAGTHIKRDVNGKYMDNRVDAKWHSWKAAWQHCEAKALEQIAIQQAKIDDIQKLGAYESGYRAGLERQQAKIDSLQQEIERLRQPVSDEQIDRVFNKCVDMYNDCTDHKRFYKAVRRILERK